MHASGARRVRLVERRDPLGHDRIGGQRRQTRSGQHHPEVGARLVNVDARLGLNAAAAMFASRSTSHGSRK